MPASDEPENKVVFRRTTAKNGATIYDIAKLAGVNPSTVSRALSTPGRINKLTEAKIRAAAKELNYRVNPFARALPTGKTKMLALMVADITNPMFFEVVRGAQDAAAAAGFTLVMTESQESAERELEAAERILPIVDGLVLVSTRLSDEGITALQSQIPVVTMNRAVAGVPSVVPNVEPGISDAVKNLANLGHKSIAYLAGPVSSWMSKHRWEILLRSASGLGLDLIEIGPNEPTLTGGQQVLSRVRGAGVTAAVAYNDLMAIGLIREAAAQGVQIPGELSIIGFDDIFGSDLTTPSTTTVKTPLRDLGRIAVQRLLNILDEAGDVSARFQAGLETSLVIRGSTGPIEKN